MTTFSDPWTALHLDPESHPFASVIFNDRWVIVTGVGGHLPGSDDISPDTREQTHQALRNVESLLAIAGSSLNEVVQLRPYITDRRHAADMDEVFRERIASPRPAAGALVICSLIDERMHVEVEVLAARGARRVTADRAGCKDHLRAG